ncbi:MAG: sigma-70 family RNA polymerase sigma factor [Planctomycetes bacterium]|nr:sigma-70 family RNA polymerase sigma factor [Planctomycetota bacterium]
MSARNRPATATPAEISAESALLAALRHGREEAFEQLVRLYGGRMLAVARRFLRNEEDARDAVQDAFVSAFKAIDRFAGNSRLSTWLQRIAINAALMKLRSKSRKPETSIDDLLPKFRDDGHPLRAPLPWKEDFDALIQRSEVRALVRERIDQLPEPHRTVLLLRDIEEFDTEHTAKLLGISTAAVKTRLHRARQALRTLLDHHFRGDAA